MENIYHTGGPTMSQPTGDTQKPKATGRGPYMGQPRQRTASTRIRPAQPDDPAQPTASPSAPAQPAARQAAPPQTVKVRQARPPIDGLWRTLIVLTLIALAIAGLLWWLARPANVPAPAPSGSINTEQLGRNITVASGDTVTGTLVQKAFAFAGPGSCYARSSATTAKGEKIDFSQQATNAGQIWLKTGNTWMPIIVTNLSANDIGTLPVYSDNIKACEKVTPASSGDVE